MEFTGFIIGVLFGAALFLAGLADPDKIIGALRLKDLHAIRVTMLAILTAMIGSWLMSAIHIPRMHLALNYLVALLLGGALVGTGIGIGGFCPATGLACVGAGRTDALISVLGMFVGGALYILLYRSFAMPIERMAAFNPDTLGNVTEIPNPAWIVIFGIAGGLTLKGLAKVR